MASPNPAELTLLDPMAEAIDSGLTAFTQANGSWLDELKNNSLFYVLLPLRIGLDQAVLPFTWDFQWTSGMSFGLFAVAAVIACIRCHHGARESGGKHRRRPRIGESARTDRGWRAPRGARTLRVTAGDRRRVTAAPYRQRTSVRGCRTLNPGRSPNLA